MKFIGIVEDDMDVKSMFKGFETTRIKWFCVDFARNPTFPQFVILFGLDYFEWLGLDFDCFELGNGFYIQNYMRLVCGNNFRKVGIETQKLEFKYVQERIKQR